LVAVVSAQCGEGSVLESRDYGDYPNAGLSFLEQVAGFAVARSHFENRWGDFWVGVVWFDVELYLAWEFEAFVGKIHSQSVILRLHSGFGNL
jgi:hypothetical protein